MDNIPKILLLKQLPTAENLIHSDFLKHYIQIYSKERVFDILNMLIEEYKSGIQNGLITEFDQDDIISKTINRLCNQFTHNLKPVINLTGIVVNQYLGRAPLSQDIISNLVDVSIGYCNLDFNLNKGTQESRLLHLQHLFKQITGAESAVIVNNNAAALMLIANTFAENKEIIISRGEIIEIEDEFRLPDIINLAHSKIVDIGTTNKSYLKDYSEAINDNTAMILKVHTSSYYIKGNTSKVELFGLIELAKTKNILCVEDIGTGLLIDLARFNLPHEPVVTDRLKSGIDLITFSGDKLFGGPQAGIILGKKHMIDLLLANPLTRVLRPGKIVLSALEATLQLYLNPQKAVEFIPVLRMLTKSIDDIEYDAKRICSDLNQFYNIDCEVKKCFTHAGGSILPEVKLPSYQVLLKHNKMDSCTLYQNLLSHSVVGLMKDDKIALDPRCLLERDYSRLSMVFEQVFRNL